MQLFGGGVGNIYRVETTGCRTPPQWREVVDTVGWLMGSPSEYGGPECKQSHGIRLPPHALIQFRGDLWGDLPLDSQRRSA